MAKAKPDEIPESPETAALAAEATEATVIEFDALGETWTFTKDEGGWPLRASLAFSEILNGDGSPLAAMKETKHIATFVRELLGEAQWRRFESAPGRKTRDLRALWDAMWLALQGASSGESSASAG